MVSSEKSPPFLSKYLTTKLEAEDYLLSDECKNLIPTILRPGFIWSSKERGWSPIVSKVVNLLWVANEEVGKKLPFSK